ncbi:hypothetical protein YC2023_107810 [Brassica napus]
MLFGKSISSYATSLILQIIKSVLVLVRELVDQRREICKRLPWVKPLLKEQFFVHCKFHLGFENQSDTVILLCKCLRQDISRRWITKEDKESEVWQYNLG